MPSLFSKRLYVKSIPNAPSGAVNKMARTATDSTMGPQGSPIARGAEPDGRLDRRLREIGNHAEKPLPAGERRFDQTQGNAMERKARAMKIMSSDAMPACSV